MRQCDQLWCGALYTCIGLIDHRTSLSLLVSEAEVAVTGRDVQRGEKVGVNARLDACKVLSVRARQCCSALDRRGQHLVLRNRDIRDTCGDGIDTSETAPSRHRFDRGLLRQSAGYQGGHADCERHVQIDLGQAVEAAVDTDRPEIVGRRKHRARTERVALYGGNRRHRERQQPCVQRMDTIEIPSDLVEVGEQPVRVESIGEELSRRGGDERGRPFDGFHFVEQRVRRIDPVRMESVLVVLGAVLVAEKENVHVTVALEIWHERILPGGNFARAR